MKAEQYLFEDIRIRKQTNHNFRIFSWWPYFLSFLTRTLLKSQDSSTLRYKSHYHFVILTLLICLFSSVSVNSYAAEKKKDIRWQKRDNLNIGYRTHAPPFAYDKIILEKDGTKKVTPTGYSVDICNRIEREITRQYPGIRVEWKGVKSHDRLEQLRKGNIDLLCGTTTVSLERLKEFESSLFIFLTGASYICTRESRVTSVSSMKGKKIGFLKGSTTEAVVDRLLKQEDIQASVIQVEMRSYDDALASLLPNKTEPSEPMVDEQGLDCFFGDRDVLAFYVNEYSNSKHLYLSNRYFSLEPYGIFMRRGDPVLANLVNKTLVRMFDADPTKPESIHWVFREHFQYAQMSDYLRMLFEVQRLPER